MNKQIIGLDQVIAPITLFAVADIIAFNNGKWITHNVTNLAIVNEMLYNFIDLGGINGINLEKLHVSINTFMCIATLQAILNHNGSADDFIDKCKNSYKNVFSHINDEANLFHTNRNTNAGLYRSLNKLFSDKHKKYFSTTENFAAIRTIPIGLYFFDQKNMSLLIDYSIKCSMITNTSPIGFLGGLVIALFTSYAINKIKIDTWPNKLMEILKSNDVLKYIDKNNESDYDKFIMYWKKYIDIKFDTRNDASIAKNNTNSNKNLVFRSNFFYNNFTDKSSLEIGSSGYSATIMAYDALFDCSGHWEKLIIYAGFHIGDVTGVASIAGGLYGAMYVYGDVPNNNLRNIEYSDVFYAYGNKLQQLLNN